MVSSHLSGDSVLEKRLLYSIGQGQLKAGLTFLNQDSIIAHKDERGTITATRNRCKHQGRQFANTNGCVLTCPGHDWKLDFSTMTYVIPTGGLKQEQLLVEETPEGRVSFYELLRAPWESDPSNDEVLDAEEFTLRFYAHACVEVRCGSRSLFTDPWLVGPAFTRGWWLVHQPPIDWLDRLASADAIYISHNHSDHLNSHTLRHLAARNPDVPIFVPAFENDYCLPLLEKIGLRNVTITNFGKWVPLGEAAHFMILRDGTGRNDSGILIDYKGHRILNTVDCQNLNNGPLPKVEVLLTSFAGGASGYPVCWEGYSEQRRRELMRNKRQAILLNVLNIVTKARPEIYVPFAGYFTEAHPADKEIKSLNVKNTPQEVCDFIRTHFSEIDTWIPQPGAILDIGLKRSVDSSLVPENAHAEEVIYDFEPYLAEIRQSRAFVPLQTQEGLRKYFAWAGFRGNLVLHVIETEENFQGSVREFYIDFQDLSFPAKRPLREHMYLRMRCRSDVFRFVLQYGLPWEEITIGFQARLFREPDIYEFEFSNHFQNKLPHTPPPW